MSYLAVSAVWSSERFDVVFCDLVPQIVPLLKRISSAKVLFYCHFPDQLLAPRRGGAHQPYRSLLARLEASGMRAADRVVVNSRFTESLVRRIFGPGIAPDLLYPAAVDERDHLHDIAENNGERVHTPTILSVNRFEKKKRLDLAIEALRLLRDRLPATVFETVQLVMTGAYDARIAEHREVLAELETLVQQHGLTEHVTLMPSCTEAQRRTWLAQCRCVIYTPPEEHFGLGPVEAMAAGRAVVGVASGGLLETVRHEETGLLCAPAADAFADALCRLILNPEEADRMGLAGRRHVSATFSRARFGATLDAIVDDIASGPD
jgi:alpha-1,3/alpha-1,6-mannosyltransferase